MADTIIVTSTNTAPVADAGLDQNVTTLRQVQLNSAGSSDADNDSLSYTWSITGPAGSTATLNDSTIVNPTFTPDRNGIYTLQLTVGDELAIGTTDTVVIASTNAAPVADTGPDQNVITLRQVQLDGSGSRDAENDSLSYTWGLNNRPAGSTASLNNTTIINPTFTPDIDGTYALTLTVNDSVPNNDDSDTVTIISISNTKPVANAGLNQNVFGLQQIQLDGSNSSDAENNSLSYAWTMTGPPNSTASLNSATIVNPTFTPDLGGNYLLQLIVNDGFVSSDPSDTITIAVTIAEILDPLYNKQWHLKNTGQNAGISGEDINVEAAWDIEINTGTSTKKIKGAGVNIRIVDDGLEVDHEDLAANIAAGQSYDYCDDDNDLANTPTSCANNVHGTLVAGVVAARDLNGLGVRGSAPQASIAGFNLLYNYTDANALDAMTRDIATVAISNNSWGPKDDTGELSTALTPAMPAGWLNSLQTGTTIGRNGLGTIYTWAAGNGARIMLGTPNGIDNSNYDAFANNRYVIAVCATNDKGQQAVYSENGANLWVCAPSGGDPENNEQNITTTDRSGGIFGSNTDISKNDYTDKNYTNTFSGTSSSTPLVAGVIALMLQANPSLGWRDVRLILAQTARKNDPADADWEVTAGSPVYNVNHKYGFGVIDAAAAVTTSRTWNNVGTEHTFNSGMQSVAVNIPDNNRTGVSDSIVVNSSMSIEFIEITFSASHAYHGDLRVELISPSGTTSVLAEKHGCYFPCTSDYDSWVFGSARHLSENSAGTWTLKVSDEAWRDTGKFESWGIKFYGH